MQLEMCLALDQGEHPKGMQGCGGHVEQGAWPHAHGLHPWAASPAGRAVGPEAELRASQGHVRTSRSGGIRWHCLVLRGTLLSQFFSGLGVKHMAPRWHSLLLEGTMASDEPSPFSVLPGVSDWDNESFRDKMNALCIPEGCTFREFRGRTGRTELGLIVILYQSLSKFYFLCILARGESSMASHSS